jgi:hypothetical protein
MIDPEVARLRRLRARALRVREIGRRHEDSRFARSAGAAWRIARVASGKLNAHPHIRYQRGASVGELVGNRVAAGWLSLIKDRTSALRSLEREVGALARNVEDVRALTWSTEFSDTLGRSLAELKGLLAEIVVDTRGVAKVDAPSGAAVERKPIVAARAEGLSLAQTIEGDWPYLAF